MFYLIWRSIFFWTPSLQSFHLTFDHFRRVHFLSSPGDRVRDVCKKKKLHFHVEKKWNFSFNLQRLFSSQQLFGVCDRAGQRAEGRDRYIMGVAGREVKQEKNRVPQTLISWVRIDEVALSHFLRLSNWEARQKSYHSMTFILQGLGCTKWVCFKNYLQGDCLKWFLMAEVTLDLIVQHSTA